MPRPGLPCEAGDALKDEVVEGLELLSGVAVSEVCAPASQEAVDLLYDHDRGVNGHRAPAGPACAVVAVRVPAYGKPAEVVAEEVKSLACRGEVDDPGFVRRELKPELGQQPRQGASRSLCLPGLPAGQHKIVGIARELPKPPVAFLPGPVEGVQVHVGEARCGVPPLPRTRWLYVRGDGCVRSHATAPIRSRTSRAASGSQGIELIAPLCG